MTFHIFTNKLIEVDGVQHFFAYSFSPHSTKEDAEKQFIQIQKHDKIKNQYCKKHNIPLLRIHYNNFKKRKKGWRYAEYHQKGLYR